MNRTLEGDNLQLFVTNPSCPKSCETIEMSGGGGWVGVGGSGACRRFGWDVVGGRRL